MALHYVWQNLPCELVDYIVDYTVDGFDQDPAYQWVVLRKISKRQQRRIEYRFRICWLPYLVVTIYPTKFTSVDYRLNFCHKDLATFEQTGDLARQITSQHLANFWNHVRLSPRSIHLRLGEGVLYEGKGHIINDTPIVGLQTVHGGHISFDWKSTLDSLLNEELLMRDIGDNLVSTIVSGS